MCATPSCPLCVCHDCFRTAVSAGEDVHCTHCGQTQCLQCYLQKAEALGVDEIGCCDCWECETSLCKTCASRKDSDGLFAGVATCNLCCQSWCMDCVASRWEYLFCSTCDVAMCSECATVCAAAETSVLDQVESESTFHFCYNCEGVRHCHSCAKDRKFTCSTCRCPLQTYRKDIDPPLCSGP